MDLNNDPFDAEIQRLGLFQKPEEKSPQSGRGQPRRRLGLMSCTDLMSKQLPPIKFIVPGIIAEGCTILAGKGKIGKSWLVMGLATAVASGGYALGSIKCEQGSVLYLALEDNERRLQSRISQLLPTGICQSIYTSTPWRRGWTMDC